ncbi:MAG: hypothetical protein LBH70_02825 [Spirochaetaceae bacterium]|jgi:hypothetical protein|nr:hypothetical protein [Spirochaetaceae bacterium]
MMHAVSRRRAFAAVFCGAFLLFAPGCSSIVQKAGEAVDGSAFEETQTAVYRTGGKNRRRGTLPGPASGEGIRVERLSRKNRGNAASVQNADGVIAIRIEALPTLRLLGTPPDAEGRFSLTTLEFLCPSLSGWNEFSGELFGSGVFRTASEPADFPEPREKGVLRLDGPAELIDITGGRTRRNSTRVTGDQAVSALRNRRERITALTEWMKARPAPATGSPVSRDGFEAYWAPILFPELAKANARPPEWTTEGAVWVRGEGVKWNTRYTGAVFPEELRPARDSGTLLRDWEEAAGWIYLQYEWDRIMKVLTKEIRLVRIR